MQDSKTTVAELIRLIDDFVAERKWEPFHDPKNLSASIAIEAAELMEHFQWLRTDELDKVKDEPETMHQIREELADIMAYVLSFASTMGIDVSSALAEIGFGVVVPEGTYFVLGEHSAISRRLGVSTDVELALLLTREYGVATIPPSAFCITPGHCANYLRFAFCKREATIEEAIARLRKIGL